MKLLHLSDLHLGKRIYEYSMLEEQEYILKCILQIADAEKPDGVVIAGDVYDKSVPSAEAVALQSIPMIKAMQYNNMNLARVINSAFIVTLPVFRQALAQNILLKRQKLQSDALAALDQRTNALLQKNARNATAQARALAAQAAEPSIQAGTLAKTWQTIVGGIEETRRLQASAREQREQDRLRLEDIRRDFMQKYNLPQDQ